MDSNKKRVGRPPDLSETRRRVINGIQLPDHIDDDLVRVARIEGLSRQQLIVHLVTLAYMDGPPFPTRYPDGYAEDVRHVREMTEAP